ncbi:FabG domain-containing protein [Thraustotheca clavata]|uniref:FabG domain-containing protein n=1 Tax=Thraustotheca clavata TaxID=74557 RepID=A0A1V9Y5C0_9STRA|nr:FabG domain-containing protein [Thraustotheca clavata]
MGGTTVLDALFFIFNKTMRLQAVTAKNLHVNFEGCKALVVGGTSGIGEAIATRLAQARFNVVVAGRNIDRGNSVVEKLHSKHPKGAHSFLPLDAQYVSDIHGLSNEFKHLDRLVCTQGISTIQARTETREGLDQKMALHYYSRIALAQEFLPLLRQSTSGPRVLSVFSAGVHSPYHKYKEDPDLKNHYSLSNAANATGFYNDLMLDALSEEPENQNVAFAHTAPGFVSTNWGTEMPWYVRTLFVRPLQFYGKTAHDCAEFMSDFLLQDKTPIPNFALLDQFGEPVEPTTMHTPEAKAFIRNHTLEVLAKIHQGQRV